MDIRGKVCNTGGDARVQLMASEGKSQYHIMIIELLPWPPIVEVDLSRGVKQSALTLALSARWPPRHIPVAPIKPVQVGRLRR